MSNKTHMTRRRLLKLSAFGTFGLVTTVGLNRCSVWETQEKEEGGEVTVEMTDDMKFEPSQVEINVGQTITWKNIGQMVHSATADPSQAQDPANAALPEGASSWDSGLLRAGQEWEYRFDTAGEYRYFCLPHEAGGMIGTITVKA